MGKKLTGRIQKCLHNETCGARNHVCKRNTLLWMSSTDSEVRAVQKMKALRTTCICMLLYTVEAIFFNAHHITFDIFFLPSWCWFWVWKVLLLNSACILHVWVSVYITVPPSLISLNLMSHNIASLPILKLSSDLDEALHFSEIASYKKKFD